MIRLFGCNAGGNTILSLDDATLDTDRGQDFRAWLLTAAFDTGPASGWATLRRFVQAVTTGGTLTLVVTPSGDGAEFGDQATTHSLSAVQGTEHLTETPLAVPGTRFQLLVEITAHTGLAELGESDQWFVVRRTGRET